MILKSVSKEKKLEKRIKKVKETKSLKVAPTKVMKGKAGVPS